MLSLFSLDIAGLLRTLTNAFNQLINHHKQRLNELLDILGHGPLNAYQAARKMKWDLTYNTWEQISVIQQWFATGEAIAHLEHLVELNKVRRMPNQGIFQFELS